MRDPAVADLLLLVVPVQHGWFLDFQTHSGPSPGSGLFEQTHHNFPGP